jgi:hypothetical protein
MIEVFEGRLGGGKSYSATSRALAHLAAGGYLFTNMLLNWENCKKYCRKHYKVELQDKQYIFVEEKDIPRINELLPRGVGVTNILCILDEVHLWFNARDWAQASRDLLAYLTQSRKMKVDLIFISQSINNIDKQFVRLVQYIWRFRDMQRFRFPILGFSWPFPQILALHYDYDGKTLMMRHWVKKSQEVFDCYDTNSLLKPIKFAGDTLDEVVLDKVSTTNYLWSRVKPYLRIIVISSLFAILALLKIFLNY